MAFVELIIALYSLGDGFIEGLGVWECQEEVLCISSKAKTKLVNQGRFSPVEVTGKLPEFRDVG